MTRMALLAFWSHWRRHPVQFFTLIAGLALATALWSAVQAINAEARASYAQAAVQLGVDGTDILTAPDGPITVPQYVALRRAGWQVSPMLDGTLRREGQSFRVLGVDLLSSADLPAFAAPEAAQTFQAADALTPPGRLFASSETAASLAHLPDLPPIIETANVPPDVVLTDIGIAEQLLTRSGQIDRLRVMPVQSAGIPPLADIAPNLRRSTQTSGETDRLTDSFHLNLTAFGLLAFAVGLFIVHGTVGLSFEQRRAMFRTLRALGLPLRRLTVLAVAELLIFAVIAGLLGLAAGYTIAGALLPDVSTTLRGLYGVPAANTLHLRPEWVASGLGMAILGTGLASVQALWRLWRMPLLAAPGLQSWAAGARRTNRIMAVIGIALFLAGVVAMVLFDGLVAGFALLAGMMLGAALILAPILSLILRLGARTANGPISEWIWADLRAQLPGVSLALMALLLALAANIGVGTMVSSFRLTFTGWLDQRLASELYVTARDDAQGAAIEDWLTPQVDAVLPIRSFEFSHAGTPLFVYGIRDHATYRDNWPLLAYTPDVWDMVASGTGVLINEQLARRSQIWPGDTLTISPQWSLPVAGVYSDYGNPTGQAIVSLDALLSHARDVPNRRFGIRVAPDRVRALSQELQTRFDLPSTALINQAGLKARSMEVFDKTFVVTGALNLLTLGVAGFAILTSLLTLWSLRLPQLAPVWALGMTRSQLARLEVVRSLALAALTALIALPLGLGLAWVLLAVINVEAFGWRLPMYLFPLDWLRLFLLALLAAGLAAVIPARRLYRLPPSDLLKVFADAR